MEIKKVCVVGGGQMGRQIALCAAIYGYEVTVYDSFPGVPEKVEAWKEEYLAGRIQKGRMTAEQVGEAKARFSVSNDINAAAGDADLIIEAIVEVYEAKAKLFALLINERSNGGFSWRSIKFLYFWKTRPVNFMN